LLTAHLETLKAIEPTLEDDWYRGSIQSLIDSLQLKINPIQVD